MPNGGMPVPENILLQRSTAHAYGITQCYLPPGRGDTPALTPAVAGTRLSDPGGMQGLVDLLGLLHIFAPSLHTLYRVIPTKWRSHRELRLCDRIFTLCIS